MRRHSGKWPCGEALCKSGSVRDFCGPVVVGGRVAAGVERVLEGLHQSVEVRAEGGGGGRGLAEVSGDEVPFALSPLCASVFEPDLWKQKKAIY